MFEDADGYHGRHAAPDEYDVMAGAAPGQPFQHNPLPPVSDPPFPGPRSWEVPNGFIPLQKRRRISTGKRWMIAAILVLALVACVGWLMRPKASNPSGERTGGAVPAAAVTYRSTQGHYVAKFAHPPKTATMKITVEGRTVSAYLAADEVAKEIVGGYLFEPPLPEAGLRNALRGGLVGMARGAQINDVVEGSFEGHPSITATLDDSSGDPAHVIVYAYSDSRFYLLAATDDAALAVLESQFRTID